MGASYTTFAGFDVLTPISAVSVAAGTVAGSLGVGIYTYKATYVTAYGETDPSPVSANVTTVTGSVNLSAIPLSPEPNVIARKLYRTTSGGGSWLLLATIADNTTTVYVDTIADGSLGSAVPSFNTAMSREIGRGILSASSPVVYSASVAVTAAAGGGQANATPLTKEYNLLTVVAVAADSVVLPTLNFSRVGMRVVVRNNAANAANVFPAVGQSINALAADTALSIAADGVTTFVAVSATAWQTF